MKIEFKIDPNYDYDVTTRMLKGKDWKYRAEEMDLDMDLVRRVNSCKGNELKKAEKDLENVVIRVFKNFAPDIEKAKNAYQKSWDLIIDEFSNTVAKLSVPWFYDKYIVNVTHFNPGISNWDGNVVGRWWKEDPDKQRRITAHEILLAHFYTIHRRLYKHSGLGREQIWALSETFAFAMTGLEPRISKFWPWDTSGYYTDHNYPQIVPLQNALRNPYLNRKGFNEYVSSGIELAKILFTA
jgi:hypothetical protein